MGWKRFSDIDDAIFELQDPKCFGIYEILVVDCDGKSVPIYRAFGIDRRGRLYIGCSGKEGIAKRIQKNREKHMGDEDSRRIRKCFDGQHYFLAVRVKFLEDGEIHAGECALLRNYKQESGELPPWNANKGSL